MHLVIVVFAIMKIANSSNYLQTVLYSKGSNQWELLSPSIVKMGLRNGLVYAEIWIPVVWKL
jgi:hypothetical protein